MVVLDFSVYSDCEDLVGNRPFKYEQLFSFHFRTSLQGICDLGLASLPQLEVSMC